MFLSQEDMQNLTGYQLPKCQIRWLRENGIRFLVGGDGHPKVLQSYLESIIGAPINTNKKTKGIDVLALEKAMGI